MHIEDVDGLLRSAADRLFQVAKGLDGRGPFLPQPAQHWYRCVHPNGNDYAWLRLIGTRAKNYPRHSIHLVVRPLDDNKQDDRLQAGKDWWGSEDRHMVIVESDQAALDHAEDVLRRNFRLVAGM